MSERLADEFGFHRLLRHAERRWRWGCAGEAALRSGRAAVALFAGAVVLDAVIPLPSAGRLATGAAVLIAVGWMAWRTGRAVLRRIPPVAVARRLERRAGLAGNPLVHAVQLPDAREGSAALRSEAARRGRARAQGLRPGLAADAAALRGEAVRFAAVGLLCGLGVASAAWSIGGRSWDEPWRMVREGVRRLAHPWGSPPSYTPLRFDVRVDPEPVPRGRSARIVAEITQPGGALRGAAAQARVVFEALPGRGPAAGRGSSATAAMRPTGGGALRFTFDVENVTAARRFHVATPGGRSRWHELRVTDAPTAEERAGAAAAERVELRVTPAPGSGGAALRVAVRAAGEGPGGEAPPTVRIEASAEGEAGEAARWRSVRRLALALDPAAPGWSAAEAVLDGAVLREALGRSVRLRAVRGGTASEAVSLWLDFDKGEIAGEAGAGSRVEGEAVVAGRGDASSGAAGDASRSGDGAGEGGAGEGEGGSSGRGAGRAEAVGGAAGRGEGSASIPMPPRDALERLAIEGAQGPLRGAGFDEVPADQREHAAAYFRRLERDAR